MRWEENELIIVLSTERYRTKEKRFCRVCGSEIPAGVKTLSIGIADRMERKAERWHVCDLCEHLFEYPSAEDAPAHVQEWLFDNRFSREIWEEN